MQLHQILTGAANVYDDSVTVSLGCVNASPFTAYGTGFDLVVLDSKFRRIQIISFRQSELSSIISCVACSQVDGKIAVSCGNQITILYPHPAADHSTIENLPFQWKQETVLTVDDVVRKISWDREGQRLVAGCNSLQLWRPSPVVADPECIVWTNVWYKRLSSPVALLSFSPDGHYIASCGTHDRMVKLWYQVHYKEPQSDEQHVMEVFNFVYILHPRSVLSFSWRDRSPYMPRGSVPNVLLTSCVDNICRIWSETVKQKPPRHQVHNQLNGTKARPGTDQISPIKQLSLRDSIRHSGQQSHLVSMLHFHLAAVINPSNDIALLSTIPTNSLFGRSFQLNWLNNKELRFTAAVEALLTDRSKYSTERAAETWSVSEGDESSGLEIDGEIEVNENTQNQMPDAVFDGDKPGNDNPSTGAIPPSQSMPIFPSFQQSVPNDSVGKLPFTLNNFTTQLLHDWRKAGDTLYCIHPNDGSLLIWLIDYLDDFSNAYYRQPQVSFASRIPAAFPKADANSLCLSFTYHCMYATEFHTEKRDSTASEQQQQQQQHSSSSDLLNRHLYLVSAHSDGSLNLWQMAVSGSVAFTGVASVTHFIRNCGPRFETTSIVSHPYLPIILSTSSNKFAQALDEIESSLSRQRLEECATELILWRSNVIGALSQSGGLTEIARIASTSSSYFSHVAWCPLVFHQSLLSVYNESMVPLLPAIHCALFIARCDREFNIYQVVLDAKRFLSRFTSSNIRGSSSRLDQLSNFIVSEQSGLQSACILNLGRVTEGDIDGDCIVFMHVFTERTLLSQERPWQSATHSDANRMILLIVSFNEDLYTAHMWHLDAEINGSNSEESHQQSDGLFVRNHLATGKVCCQALPLPSDVVIDHFSTSSDTSSASSSNPSCPIPFCLVAACCDGKIHFIQCIRNETDADANQSYTLITGGITPERHLALPCPPMIEYNLGSSLQAVSCASPLLIAWIQCPLSSMGGVEDSQLLHVHICECSSSGGQYWQLEHCTVLEDMKSHLGCCGPLGRKAPLLSWMSLENGSHLLTVATCKNVWIMNQTHRSNGTVTWQQLSFIDICSADNDTFRMTSLAWALGGHLVVGVETELRVYSQWEHVLSDEDNGEGARNTISNLGNLLGKAASSVYVLPQYHPNYLMELMNFGKRRRVKAILSHVVSHLAGCNVDMALEGSRSRAQTLTRTYSGGSSLANTTALNADIELDANVDYCERIQPLSLSYLLSLDSSQSLSSEPAVKTEESSPDDYNALFSSSLNIIEGGTEDSQPEVPEVRANQDPCCYGLAQSHVLAHHLARNQLEGVSSQDQLYLLALSDTVATTKIDLEEHNALERGLHMTRKLSKAGNMVSNWGGGGGYATTGAIGASSGSGGDAVDDCGLRFLLAMRQHTALLQSMSLKQKNVLNEKGLPFADFAWAFHSDCQEELVAMIPAMLRGEATWTDLRSHGVGWWVRSSDSLKRIAEKIAKNHFQIKQEPLDCAIFYLAMKKKSLLCALFRSLRDTKMSMFFGNDFTTDRWRKAALKNAFALLGKQRFHHAAAFFLLGNALWDAVQICVERIHDIQLALTIARLYEDDHCSHTSIYNRILLKYVLCVQPDSSLADPFLQSMSLWILDDYQHSLDVLLLCSSNNQNHYEPVSVSVGYPHLFNFYFYLRNHPLIQHHLSSARSNSDLPSFFKSQTDPLLSCPNASLDAILNMSKQRRLILERRLFFLTASSHLTAGMPSLALEVLGKLQDVSSPNTDQSCDLHASNSCPSDRQELAWQLNRNVMSKIVGPNRESMQSETPKDIDWSQPISSAHNEKEIDWSQPISSTHDVKEIDWSQPISSTHDVKGIDWSQPISSTHDVKEIDWSQPISSTHDVGKPETFEVGSPPSLVDGENIKDSISNETVNIDIAAGLLKYKASLSCLLSELRCLPFSCEVEKTRLRSTLSSLLQTELSVMHRMSDFNYHRTDSSAQESEGESVVDVKRETLAEKMTRFDQQVGWIRVNQKTLTTLFNFCIMQSCGGSDLPALTMELLLLLHEAEQHHSLATPLRAMTSARPSAPPLLLASDSSYSFICSPTSYVRSMVHDVLHTILQQSPVPSIRQPISRLVPLQQVIMAVSSCIYHSLYGGRDDALLEAIRCGEVHVVNSRQHHDDSKRNIDFNGQPTSVPSEWPGVQFLQTAMLAPCKETSEKLKILLCEAAVAVYSGLLSSAMSTLKPRKLHSLVTNPLSGEMWGRVFGGGAKLMITRNSYVRRPSVSRGPVAHDQRQRWDTARMKWYSRLLGRDAPVSVSSGEEAKATQCEIYIPPEISLYEVFLKQDQHLDHGNEWQSDDDDDGDDDDEDDDDDGLSLRAKKQPLIHTDDESYAWLIIKLSLLQNSIKMIQGFVVTAGLELSDLPGTCPLVHSVLNTFLQWQQQLKSKLDRSDGPPSGFIHDAEVVAGGDGFVRGGRTLGRYKSLIDPSNSPFRSSSSRLAYDSRQLWCILVRLEPLRQTFLRYSFPTALTSTTQLTMTSADDEVDGGRDYVQTGDELLASKIIYKDQEPLLNFCFNSSNANVVALTTAKEIIELDTTNIFNENQFIIQDDIDFDVNINPINATSTAAVHDYHVVSAVNQDRNQQSPFATSFPNVCLKRPLAGVRRMTSHPHLPYYITGSSDGSLRMWEYGHPDHITLFQAPGSCERINAVHFNPLGNKFGVVDDGGGLSLWVIGNAANPRPYIALKSHGRQATDFAFIGSSSLVAVAGQSSDNKNLCLIDTLLPPNNAIVHGFTGHDQYCQTLSYVAGQQAILSCSKKGNICIFDVRQRRLLNSYQDSNETSIRCVATNATEEIFATGSSDGDLKIWSLDAHERHGIFEKEHAKSTYLRHSSAGVQCLRFTSAGSQLYSCGADGSLKWRQLYAL